MVNITFLATSNMWERILLGTWTALPVTRSRRNGGPFASPARIHFQIAPPANGGTSWKKSSPGGTVLPANMPDWPALRSAIEETTSTWDDANPTITLPPHFISVIFLTRCS